MITCDASHLTTARLDHEGPRGQISAKRRTRMIKGLSLDHGSAFALEAAAGNHDACEQLPSMHNNHPTTVPVFQAASGIIGQLTMLLWRSDSLLAMRRCAYEVACMGRFESVCHCMTYAGQARHAALVPFPVLTQWMLTLRPHLSPSNACVI